MSRIKNILLTLEKRGFLVFHKVTDTNFMDDIENIAPCFTTDVYGIFYYTYDDYLNSLQTGYMDVNYMPLEDDNINIFLVVREICNGLNLSETLDYDFKTPTCISFKVNKAKEMTRVPEMSSSVLRII